MNQQQLQEEEDLHQKDYQLIKTRLSNLSPVSCFYPDSLTRRGEEIILRHHSLVVNIEAEIKAWDTFVAVNLPEFELVKLLQIDSSNIRVYLRRLTNRCSICDEPVYTNDALCPSCDFEQKRLDVKIACDQFISWWHDAREQLSELALLLEASDAQ